VFCWQVAKTMVILELKISILAKIKKDNGELIYATYLMSREDYLGVSLPLTVRSLLVQSDKVIVNGYSEGIPPSARSK
jgi:hypothetical protein